MCVCVGATETVCVCVRVRESINMQSYADALSAKGYRSFGFDTDVEMDMDMGLAVRRIEKRKGGEWTKYKHMYILTSLCASLLGARVCVSGCTLIIGQQSIYSLIACSL